MRVSLDHAHIFASNPAATVEFLQTMFGASVVWDEVVAGVRGIRLQIGRAFVHIYDQPPKGPRGGAVHHLGIETDGLVGLVRKMTSRGFVFRNPIREDEAFKVRHDSWAGRPAHRIVRVSGAVQVAHPLRRLRIGQRTIDAELHVRPDRWLALRSPPPVNVAFAIRRKG